MWKLSFSKRWTPHFKKQFFVIFAGKITELKKNAEILRDAIDNFSIIENHFLASFSITLDEEH